MRQILLVVLGKKISKETPAPGTGHNREVERGKLASLKLLELLFPPQTPGGAEEGEWTGAGGERSVLVEVA